MAGKWLPTAEGAFVTWFVNYHNKLTTIYSATFGLAAGEITALNNDLAALQHAVALSGIFKAKAQDVNEYKRNLIYGPGPIGAFPGNPTLPAAPTAVAANLIARIDAMVARIKADPDYSTAIGNDLGIEAPTPEEPKTQIEITRLVAKPNSWVEIHYSLLGNDGVYVESSVDGGPFQVLGTDRHSPMVDTRAPAVAGKAEVRTYRIRPLDGDTPIGDWSNSAQVSTTP